MKKKRRRSNIQSALEERLAEDTELLREQAKTLRPGATLDRLKRIRQNEAAANLTQWLASPSSQPAKHSLLGQKPILFQVSNSHSL